MKKLQDYYLPEIGTTENIVTIKLLNHLQTKKIIEFVDEFIEAKQKEIAEKNGFRISYHSHIVYGVCSGNECQKNH